LSYFSSMWLGILIKWLLLPWAGQSIFFAIFPPKG
jgi:hypothetical protein